MSAPHPSVINHFLHLVGIDTQSSHGSKTKPSTPGQIVALLHIKAHMESLGLECEQLKHGTLMVTIPATPGYEHIKPVAFAAHVDTAPDASGKVKPIIHKYAGGNIVLPNGKVINLKDSKVLQQVQQQGGGQIITSDGTSLLGGDNKGGCASLMAMAEKLVCDGNWVHPEIILFFSPDEEIGEFGSDLPPDVLRRLQVLYTPDGLELGSIDNSTNSITRLKSRLSSVPEARSAESIHRFRVIFKGSAGHPGIYIDQWKPGHSAACHLMIDLGPHWTINSFYGNAGQTSVVLGSSEEGSATELKTLVQKILKDHPDVKYRIRKMKSVTTLNHYPHLKIVATFGHQVHINFPVATQRGPDGKGYFTFGGFSDKHGERNFTEFFLSVSGSNAENVRKMIEALQKTVITPVQEQFSDVDIKFTELVCCHTVAVAIDAHPGCLDPMVKAMEKMGIRWYYNHVSGGTDGGMLNNDYPDLPCPNLGYGSALLHTVLEHVSYEHLCLMPDVLCHCTQNYALAA